MNTVSSKSLILLSILGCFLFFASTPTFAQKYIGILRLTTLLKSNDKKLMELNFNYHGYYKKYKDNNTKEWDNNNFYDNYGNLIQLNNSGLSYLIEKYNKETLDFYENEIKNHCYKGYYSSNAQAMVYYDKSGRYTILFWFKNETDLCLSISDNTDTQR